MPRYFYLTPMLGGPGVPRFPVNERPQIIGRSYHADIPLLEPTISRQHARVEVQGEVVILKDLGSKHGTFVNSRRVGQTRLRAGDIVVFGLSLVMRLEESDRPVAAPSAMKEKYTLAKRPDSSRENIITAVRTVTVPPRVARRVAHAADSIAEASRGSYQSIKLQKLAAAGALFLARLPHLTQELEQAQEWLRAMTTDHPEAGTVRTLVDSVLAALGGIAEELTPPPRPLDQLTLAEVVQEATWALADYAASLKVQILSNLAPELQVRADRSGLVHALTEVLRNAITASPPGSMVELLATTEDEHVILAISDQGPGIPTEMLERVFDPFVTVPGDTDRLGLGLYEARQIVHAQGATLRLDSRLGHGTTVRLILPAAP